MQVIFPTQVLTREPYSKTINGLLPIIESNLQKNTNIRWYQFLASGSNSNDRMVMQGLLMEMLEPFLASTNTLLHLHPETNLGPTSFSNRKSFG